MPLRQVKAKRRSTLQEGRAGCAALTCQHCHGPPSSCPFCCTTILFAGLGLGNHRMCLCVFVHLCACHECACYECACVAHLASLLRPQILMDVDAHAAQPVYLQRETMLAPDRMLLSSCTGQSGFGQRNMLLHVGAHTLCLGYATAQGDHTIRMPSIPCLGSATAQGDHTIRIPSTPTKAQALRSSWQWQRSTGPSLLTYGSWGA